MLLKCVISNFKSIGHPIEFSMIPTDNNIDEKFTTILKTSHGDFKVLRRGGFFGPNASGKSSFIQAVEFARSFIVDSRRSGKSIFIDQFKGNFSDLECASVFQFVFFSDDDIYEYGFSLNYDRVIEEWLMIRTENDFEPLFIRGTDENSYTQVEISDRFAEEHSKERAIAELTTETIKSEQRNQLFLYKLKENGNEKAERIIGWFERLITIFPSSTIRELPLRLRENEEMRKFLSKSLRELDTGVDNIALEDIDFRKFAEKNKIPLETIRDLEDRGDGMLSFKGEKFFFSEIEGKMHLVKLQFSHKLNGKEKIFDIENESDGTQRLLDLLPILFRLQEDGHVIYFIDEIDRSLHTQLSKYLLSKFLNNSSNGSLSQIVFTAHDVSLIDVSEFSQEEIWFIEKNQLGETRLKPFSDFDIKENQNTIKDYLNGRFGAIPVIGG